MKTVFGRTGGPFGALVKEEYGVKLGLEDLGEIKNVGGIKTVLRKHKINV